MAKMTKKELFNTLLGLSEVRENQELVLGLTHELELLERKQASSKKDSKITEDRKAELLEALAYYPHGVSLKDLIANEFAGKGYTSQKLVPVVKALINEGLVSREMVKRTAVFKVI